MKIAALEYACACTEGGKPDGKPFLKEGCAMLKALLNDLNKIEGATTYTLLSAETNSNGLNADKVLKTGSDFFESSGELFKQVDAAWIIAPESGGTLLRLARMAHSTGTRLLGSSPDAIEKCADKYSLAQFLQGEIPMPPTELLNGNQNSFPCIVKPVTGAGCENIYYIENSGELAELKIPEGKFIIQPYIEGEKLSAGILSVNDMNKLLGVCKQDIQLGKPTRLNSVELVSRPDSNQLTAMIEKIVKLIPGLNGYWGIDFIDDGRNLTLIEINPRLTLSYPLYSASSNFNIAESLSNAAFCTPTG